MYIYIYIYITVCTDFSDKGPHNDVCVDKVLVSWSLDSVMVSMPALELREVWF